MEVSILRIQRSAVHHSSSPPWHRSITWVSDECPIQIWIPTGCVFHGFPVTNGNSATGFFPATGSDFSLMSHSTRAHCCQLQCARFGVVLLLPMSHPAVYEQAVQTSAVSCQLCVELPPTSVSGTRPEPTHIADKILRGFRQTSVSQRVKLVVAAR